MIPGSYSAIAGGTFTAYGDIFGTGDPSQVAAQVSSVNLAVTPRAGGAPAYSGSGTIASDSSGAYVTNSVTGLAPGKYDANWTLTDHNGDTRVSGPDPVRRGAGQHGHGHQRHQRHQRDQRHQRHQRHQRGQGREWSQRGHGTARPARAPGAAGQGPDARRWSPAGRRRVRVGRGEDATRRTASRPAG